MKLLAKKSCQLRKGVKLLGGLGIAAGVLSALLAATAGAFLFKLCRLLDKLDRAIPTLEEAAVLYLEKEQRVGRSIEEGV